MPAPGVRVSGLPKLRRALRDAGANLDDLKDANAAAAALVATASVPRAPRRTGRLASSVRGNRAAGRASIVAGGSAIPYAGPIHWGWPARNIAAQPFISDTAIATEGQWLPLYEQAIETVVQALDGIY